MRPDHHRLLWLGYHPVFWFTNYMEDFLKIVTLPFLIFFNSQSCLEYDYTLLRMAILWFLKLPSFSYIFPI